MSRSRDVSDQRTSDQATPDQNQSKSQSKNKTGHKRRRTIGFMPLEPRVMYDGAAVATAATAHHHHHDGGPSADSSHAGEAASAGAPNAVTPSVSAPTPSGGDGHWHQAAPAEPMPHVTTWVKDPTEIVFIDQQAPDYQLLASGVKPGIEVVLLDPNSDGIQQIANFLKRHPDPNLTTIDIVAHGQDGMLFLGNAVLDNDTVGQYAAQLKTIGASLQPGGDLMLYGCDVAANPDGINLLAQIIDETGVNVAASTGPVGSAAEGGSWALNAQSGVIDAKSPFTAATMAAYPDVLNADLFVTTYNNGTGASSLLADQNGTVSSSNLVTNSQPQQIVLDTADNLYFVLESVNNGPNEILEGQISLALAGTPVLHQLYADTTKDSHGDYQNYIAGMQIDTATRQIYFVDNINGDLLQSATHNSVFEKIRYSATPLTADINTPTTVLNNTFLNQTNTQALTVSRVVAFTMDFGNPSGAEAAFAVDTAEAGTLLTTGQVGPVFLSAITLGFSSPPTAQLYTATNIAAGAAALTTTISQVTTSIPGAASGSVFPESKGEFDSMGSLAINNGVLYFTLQGGFTGTGASTNFSSTVAGLYSYNLGSGAFGTIFTETPSTSTNNFNAESIAPPTILADAITIDTATNTYYAVDNWFGGVYAGSLTGNTTPTLISAFTSQVPVDTSVKSLDIVVDDAPVVTAGGTTTSYGEGGPADRIDTALTVISSTARTLASATVTIANNQTGDALSFNSGNTDNFTDGGVISSSFSSGTLTLSGAASVADYQIALQNVTFTSTSSTAGSRTINFSVNDGLLSSNTGTDHVTVSVPPSIIAGATMNFTGGGTAVTLDNSLVLADSTDPVLARATVTEVGFITGDVLNFTNTNSTTEGNIAGSYASGVLTLTSAGNTATLAQWQTALQSVTYSFSPVNGDPTNGGGTTRHTIDWQFTDTTAQSSNVANSFLNTLHAAPTVTAGNTTFFGVGGTAVAIDNGLVVTDPDSGDNLTGATVTISSGLLNGDTLSFTAVGNITGSYSNGTLQLSGNGTVEQYQAVLESVTYASTAADPTNVGADTSRGISWTVTDGNSSHGTSAAASSTILIDTAPGITAGGFVNYTGGGSPVVLDSNVTLSDSFGSLSRATVTITLPAPGDTLMINGATSGTISNGGITYSSSGSTLVLSGTATTAQYEAALESVTYVSGDVAHNVGNDPTGGGGRTSVNINWQVTDTAALTSNIATVTLDTTHVAPTVTIGSPTAAVFDGGSAASGALDNTLVITDTDSGGNLTGAMVQIVNPVAGEVLNFTALDGVKSTYSNGVLTITGPASLADYETMLRSVTVSFSPQNLDPTAGGTVGKQLVYWIVNDGNTVNGTNETFPGTNAINNDQPSFGLNQIVVEAGPFPSTGGMLDGIPMGAIRTFAGANTGVFTTDAVPADGQLLGISANAPLFSLLGTSFGGDGVTDFDLPNLQGRVIVGSAGPDGTSFGSNQFTLTHQNLPPGLGGSGTAFDNDQPSLQVNYIINIGGAFAANSTNVMGEVVPFLGDFAPAGYAFANGQLLSISANPALFSIFGTTYGGDGRFTFALPDLNGKTIIGAGSDAQQTVVLGATTGQDSTTLTNQNAPSPLGPDQPVSNDQPSLALTYLVATQGVFPNGSFEPDLPVIGEVIAYAGGGSGLVDMLQEGWAVANGATVAIQTNLALFDVLGTTYGGNGTTTFNLPDLVGRTVAGVSTNQGTTTTLGEQFGTSSFTLTSGNSATQNIPVPDVATSVLTLVHEPPVVTAGASPTFDGGGSPVQIDSNLSVSAPDSSDTLTGATVQITGGFHAGDTLSFINNGTTEGNIAGNYANGALTLSSAGNTATSEQYQAALDSITYSFNPANGDPTIGNTDTVRTISYVVNDGLANSAAVTSTLNVVHIPPSVTAGNAATFEFGGTPATLDGALQLSDPDSGDMLTGATVKLDNGFLPGDSLNFTTQGSITVASNANGVLMLTGNATTEQYQAALDSITFSTTNQIGTSHTIDWTVSDQASTSAVATSTVMVLPGPVITAGATATFTGGTASSGPLDSGLTITDTDGVPDLTGASVSITSGFLAGDTLNFTAQNGIQEASYSNGVLTLTGTATVAQYQAALESVSYSFTAGGDPTQGGADTARVISWQTTDTLPVTSAAATSTLQTVHVAPTVTAGATATFNVGTPAGFGPLADGALTVGDVDSGGDLAGATIKIANAQTGDSLSFVNQNGISGSISGSTLTLSGAATLSEYQTALESITFNSTSTSTASRTIDWTVTDGNASHGSNVTPATSTVNITTVALTTTETITLTTDADHDGGTSPGDTVTGTITIKNTGSSAVSNVQLQEVLNGLTQLPGSVTVTPIAVNDTYNLVGNTPLTVDAAHGLLANDIDFNGQTPTFGTFTSGVTGGTVSVNSDGSFTFTPTTGFSGVASFTYLVKDAAAGNSDQSATVTFNVSAPVWYVDSAASTTNMDGSLAHPFTTIAGAVNAAALDTNAGSNSNGVNNTIFVENAGSTYTATSGITLAQGEQLLGDGSSLTSVNGNSVGLSGSNPIFLVSSSGNAVTLNSNNTISGIDITNTGSGAGISNNGTTTGGNTIGTLMMSDIAVNTNSGTGISLTYDTNGTNVGGTVDITGTGNTIHSASGTALDITNTNIGSSGVTFESISSGSGSNDGIILDNTGSFGGLTVTGDGSTVGSGGTIEGKTGTTGGATNGIGIYLNNTSDVSIAYMQLDNLSYDGIYGQLVTNFSMDHTVVNGANGSATGEGSVIFGSGQYGGGDINGITGVASITNSTISGGWNDNVDVFDWSGLLNITFNNDTFGDNNTTHGNQNVYIAPAGISVINATLTNSHWIGVAGGSNFYFNVESGSSTGSNLSFIGNVVADDRGGSGGDGGSGIFEAVASSFASTSTFDIENNAFTGANGNAVIIANDQAGSPTTTATLNLTFSGNTIGAAAGTNKPSTTDGFGSADGMGLWVQFNGGTMNATVANNYIYEFATNGIDFQGGLASSQGNDAGTLNATVIGNTIEDPSTSAATRGALQYGIYVDAGPNNGATNSYAFNLTIGGSATGDAAAQNIINIPESVVDAFNGGYIALSQDGDTGSPHPINLTAESGTSTLSAYGGPGNDSAGQVEAFLTSNNSTPVDPNGYAVAPLVNNNYGGGSPTATAPATGPTFGTPTVGGTDTEGSTLTASIIGGSGIAYQWQEAFSSGEWVNISGANSSNFTLTEAQVGATLRVVETSIYSGGLVDTVASAATVVIADNLTLTQPAITGNDTVGQILTASTPTVSNSDATITYQWQDNGVNISGATGQTYRVAAADVGHTIDVVATATDPHSSITATGTETGTAAAFTAQSLSNMSIGTLAAGQTFTVTFEATVNSQTNQLIVNPVNFGTVSSSAGTIKTNTVVTQLDTLTLGGEIFNDANGDGLLDNGETGIGGVALSVFAQNGTTALETVTTNSSGVYDFTGLAAGNYFVEVAASNFGSGGALAAFTNASSNPDTTPNDYLGGRNYGLALSNGVVNTSLITIAYDKPHPTGAITYPGDDTTNTLDIGFVQGPHIAGAGDTVQFYQNGAAIPLDSGFAVTDPAGANITSATVTITDAGSFVPGDVLSFTSQFGITGGYNPSTGVLSLSGSASAADYQTVLDSITYAFTGDPTVGGTEHVRTVTYTVGDANSTGSAPVANTIDIFGLPVVSAGSATTPTVTTTSGAVVADATLSVTDPNGITTLAGATIVIGGAQAGDTLTDNGISDGSVVLGNIHATFSGDTLTLSGTDTVQNYITALDEVKFDAVNPNSGTRTLTWTVDDEAGGHTNDSAPVTTSAIATFGPQITAGATATFTGGGTTPVALDSNLTISDFDGETNLTGAKVTISSGFITGDMLNFTNTADITELSYNNGVLMLTGNATVAEYQAALASITYSFSPTNGDPTSGGDTTRTISWQASDAQHTSPTATSTLDTVHVAPTVLAGGTAIFTGGTAASGPLDPTLQLSDVDSSDQLTGATVTIGQGLISGDTLNFTGQNGISGSYSNGVLSLTGNATVEQYQTALESITYSFTPGGDATNGGADTARTISWTVNDGNKGNGQAAAGSSTLDTVHVAPVVQAGALVQFAGGSATPVVLDGNLTVTDADSNDTLTGASVAIAGGGASGDTLSFTAQSGITGSYSNGVLTLQGNATVEQYQAALRSVTYSFSPTNGDPSANGFDFRLVSWTVNDGNSSQNTAGDTSLLEVNHVPPTVQAGGSAIFTGGSATPVTLDGTLALADVDSSNQIVGASVAISSGLTTGDTLSFTTQGAITGGYINGVLTLQGNATVAQYQAALESVSYSFTAGGDPTAGGTDTTRGITWTVNDGNTFSGIAADTSTLTTVHVPPLVQAGAAVTFTGGSATPVTLDGTLSITNIDSNDQLTGATVAIAQGLTLGDTLNFTAQNGITGSYSSGVLTLSGNATIEQYQAVLDSVTYSFSPTNGDPTAGGGDTVRLINWTVNDGNPSGNTATVTSTLTTVHVPPTLTTGGTVTFVQQGSPATADSTLTLSDPDSGGLIQGATVQISSGLLAGDTLSADTTGLPAITVTYSNGELMLSGPDTLADYQAVLRSVAFSSSSSNPTSDGTDPIRTLTWTVNDGASTNTTTQTSTIDVHAQPTVVAGAAATFTGGGSAVPLDGTTALSDFSSKGLTGATVSITSGLISADTLNFTNQNGITGVYNNGVLTLSGAASLADYQAALDSITYSVSPTNADPTGGGADTARTISWQVTDGVATSATATSTLTTVHVPASIKPDAPVTFTQNGPAVPIDATLALDDVDSNGQLTGATVSINSGLLPGDTLTANTAGTTITASYSHGVLTLTGADTVADYKAVLQSVNFSSNGSDPTSDGTDTSRGITWTVNDGVSTTTATGSVNVSAVPTVVAGADVSFQAGPNKTVVLDAPIGVFDDTPLTGATVTIAGGFQSGDVLAANTNGTSITASYNNGVLTLSGNDTQQHYQAVMASVTLSSTQFQDGNATIDWQVTDTKGHTSAVATSKVEVSAATGSLPLNNQGNPLPPPSPDNNQVANFSGLTTLVTNTGTGPTFDGFSPPGAVHVIHSDVTASIGPDGNVAFNLPLDSLQAALGGDVVSVTASLADGQPLPTWLHFDTQNGQFAGLLPDNTATGSLTDGGFGTKPNDKPLLPEKITIEVVARDSHGNISITDFVIDISVRTPPKHSWNVLPGHGGFEHWGMLRDTAVPLTGEPILWDGELATDIGRDGVIHVADPVPAGRAGFSEQLKVHGLHALNADRAALLKNLRHVNWR